MTDHKILAGFGRVDITPAEAVPLAGYGNTMTRMSQGVLDPLYATCIALTDRDEHTLLLYTVDLINCESQWSDALRDTVSQQHAIGKENIIVSAIHTHSAPDLTQTGCEAVVRYADSLVEKLAQAAEAALADRKPATALCGTAHNEGLNFVRHYVLENGRSFGDNYGNAVVSPIVGHRSEADREIRLVKLCRDGGKDILLVNWQAHPNKASTGTTQYGRTHRPYITADFVGSCRKQVEQETGMEFAYFQGACGNLNSRTSMKTEVCTDDHVLYGQQLSRFILSGLDDLKPLELGAVQAGAAVCTSAVNHTEDHLLPQAQDILALWRKTNDASLCMDTGDPMGIHSAYHAFRIIERASLEGELHFTVGAGCAGDLAFAAFPYEMFDTNGKYVRDHVPFPMTFILENANGSNSYIPSRDAFNYGCYEADSCKFMPGTGEKAAELAVGLLQTMKQERETHET